MWNVFFLISCRESYIIIYKCIKSFDHLSKRLNNILDFVYFIIIYHIDGLLAHKVCFKLDYFQKSCLKKILSVINYLIRVISILANLWILIFICLQRFYLIVEIFNSIRNIYSPNKTLFEITKNRSREK